MGALNVILCWAFSKCAWIIFRCFVKFPIQLSISSLNYIKTYAMSAIKRIFCSSRSSSTDSDERDDRASIVDKQPRPLSCKECSALKKKNEDLLKALGKEERTNKHLQLEKRGIEKNYNELKKRSDELTERMACVFGERSDYENVNDEFCNTRLSKRFQRLYNNTWTILSEWIEENIPDMEEMTRIANLTYLMEYGYGRCIKVAEEELRVFLFLKDEDRLPSKQEDPELYKLRRKYGQTEVKREGIVRLIFEELTKKKKFQSMLADEEPEKSKGLEIMRKFFCDYIECCWLMTISHPRLILDFNVIDHTYIGYVKDRFSLFPCQDTVVDKSRRKGTVSQVVWPSVELEDGTGIYAKGDVIVVDIGKDQPATESDKSVSGVGNDQPATKSDKSVSDMGNDQPATESDKSVSGVGNDQHATKSDISVSDMGNDQPATESDKSVSGVGNDQPATKSDKSVSDMGNDQPAFKSDKSVSDVGNDQPSSEDGNTVNGDNEAYRKEEDDNDCSPLIKKK